ERLGRDGGDEFALGDEQDSLRHAATSFTKTSSSVGRAISMRAGGTAIASRGMTDEALAPSRSMTLQPPLSTRSTRSTSGMDDNGERSAPGSSGSNSMTRGS